MMTRMSQLLHPAYNGFYFKMCSLLSGIGLHKMMNNSKKCSLIKCNWLSALFLLSQQPPVKLAEEEKWVRCVCASLANLFHVLIQHIVVQTVMHCKSIG